MDEFTFINSIKQSYYRQSSVIKGIGDDAAVFRAPHNDLVTAVDTFVEGVHFTKATMSPEQIGYRVLAANLSDMAAMAATPIYYLISVVIPSHWNAALRDIFTGMKRLAHAYRMDLIGGDTVSGDQLTISVTVIGKISKGRPRYRSDAREGDVVFVTGTLGDARAGLYIMESKEPFLNRDYFIHRHQHPTPRIEFAEKLQSLDRVALNDISDGIVSEASEIASASKQNIVLKDHLIPVSPHFDQFPTKLQTEWKLFGGEDFELMGTVAKNKWDQVQQIGQETNTEVSKVGYVSRDDRSVNQDHFGQILLHKNGKRKVIAKRGYTHLT